jgi:hypothetical protein
VYNNKEYQMWLNANIVMIRGLKYPEPLTGPASRRCKHIIMLPDTFRKVLMMINTSKANRIREYYISLEKLLIMYTKYQCGNLNIPTNKRYTRYCSIMEMDREVKQRYKVGCVYYIQEEESKSIKIGWCWNLPKRLQTLQVCNSRALNIVKYELTQFPYDREQELHEKYMIYHVRGEWFSSHVLIDCEI